MVEVDWTKRTYLLRCISFGAPLQQPLSDCKLNIAKDMFTLQLQTKISALIMLVHIELLIFIAKYVKIFHVQSDFAIFWYSIYKW